VGQVALVTGLAIRVLVRDHNRKPGRLRDVRPQPLDLNLTDLEHSLFLSLKAQPLFAGEVEVTGLRADIGETPVTVTNVERDEIERRYWAQDVPIFLSPVPGFYAYNDSGNGIGYSYFFLRGFDMRRTAVSINGVPLNDAHSHGLFFIDLADFLATAGDIQVQRGVGTTLYGGSAIGGSINLRTREPAGSRRFRVVTLGGAYNTSRLTLEFDTGLMDDRWAATFRYSQVKSDGYRDQSWAEMWNYSPLRGKDHSAPQPLRRPFGDSSRLRRDPEGIPRWGDHRGRAEGSTLQPARVPGRDRRV